MSEAKARAAVRVLEGLANDYAAEGCYIEAGAMLYGAACVGKARPAVTEPATEVPNRLLALLVGADHCEHAADYCCHDCMTKAMDEGLVLLEGGGA